MPVFGSVEKGRDSKNACFFPATKNVSRDICVTDVFFGVARVRVCKGVADEMLRGCLNS